MSARLRWGIIGTGNIARQFARGVNASERGSLAAVASRANEPAAEFAKNFDVGTAFGSYQAMLDDPGVDAVYVSLPNSMHHEWTIKALRAGKHVLCEKPFATNLAEAEEMYAVADACKRTLMEAFMYRCHPQTDAVQKLVADGAIGELKLIRSSFCYRTTNIDGNVRFSSALAGGGLMDVGCYCLNFSRMLAGEPLEASVIGRVHPTGVDDLCGGWLRFPNGVVATFSCGMTVQADNTAYVCGSEGYIEIPVPWKPGSSGATITLARSTPPKMDVKAGGAPAAPPRQTMAIAQCIDMYALEADSFAAAALDGVPLRVTREDTLGNQRWLDVMRKQLGLSF